MEHIQPRATGGTDDPENLAWSCDNCNGAKFTATSALDPITGVRVALFHPRQDRWSDHFLWSDDFVLMIGRTPTGRATVERLQLNREPNVEARRVMILAGKHPPEEAP